MSVPDDIQTACLSGPGYCPNCGEPVPAEIAEGIARKAVSGQRRLLKRTLDGHEVVQQTLAYEIHEDLIQPMIGNLLRFQAVDQLLTSDVDAAAVELRAVARTLCDSIDQARRIANRLRPPILDEFGIVAGINYLAAEFETKAELEIEFSHDGKLPRMPAAVEVAVYRIVEQLLWNVARHGQTRKVRVELARREGHLHVEVRDWGVGFDPAVVEGDGFGLQQVGERAKLLGGGAVVDSSAGEGTRVVVDLPVENSGPSET